MIIERPEEADFDTIRRNAATMNRIGDEHSTPILGAMDGGPARMVGSGFFFRCEQDWFLVSAAHVFQEFFPNRGAGVTNDREVVVPYLHNKLMRLGGKLIQSKKSDVGVLHLSDPSLVRERWSAVSAGQLDDGGDPHGWYYFAGYPTQWSKHEGNAVNADKYRFVGPFDPGPVSCHPKHKLVIPLDRNHHFDGNGVPGRVPHLEGISGCAVWRIIDGRDPLRRFAPRLAGIETHYETHGSVWYVCARRWIAAERLIEIFIPGRLRSAKRLGA